MKKTILQRENNRETGAAAVAPAFGRSGTSEKELSARIIFLICALFSIVAVLMIVFYLLFVSIPAFREIGVFNFLFKKLWNSDRWADGGNPSEYFGILPEIVSSLVITLGAVLLGGLLGVCSAIFMVYYCPKKVKGLYTQLINLLAGIPSIVFGFVGLEVLVRGFRELFDTPSGMGPLPAVIVLALMIMPTIALPVQKQSGIGAKGVLRGLPGHGKHQGAGDFQRLRNRGEKGNRRRPHPGRRQGGRRDDGGADGRRQRHQLFPHRAFPRGWRR